jgi:hypothetical protein
MTWLLNNISAQRKDRRKTDAYRAVMQYEARLGGELFGPIPKGNRREFFCLDERTWVWHEEYTDENGQRQIITTRYDVRPGGILKSQGTNSYVGLSNSEERHFRQAVRLYHEKIGGELRRLAATR